MAKICTSFFYPFLQKIKPVVSPSAELEKVSDNIWNVKKDTAFFTLKSHYFKFLSGWISIHLELDSENVITPKILIDFGEEYPENNLTNMDKIEKNTYEIQLMLSKTPKNIYLYPTTIKGATFTIKSLEVKSHSKFLEIIKQVFSIIKHDYKTGASLFRIYHKSFKRYKNSGLDVMLVQLDQEYKKIHPYTMQDSKIKTTPYKVWIDKNEKFNTSVYNENAYSYRPTISVVIPICITSEIYLKKSIDSVIDQIYPHWELCMTVDTSINSKTIKLLNDYESTYENITIIYRNEKEYIEPNIDISPTFVTGEFVVFLDCQDMLSKNALLEVVGVINKNPNVKFLYSDEDKIDEKGIRFEPHFKSDWNPDKFYATNYIAQLSVIKYSELIRAGGVRYNYESSNQYDLYLRVLDGIETNDIVHIDKILYHARKVSDGTAIDKEDLSESDLNALTDYFYQKNKNIIVEHGIVPNTFKVSYPLPLDVPLVSIIIPTRDGFDILSKCVESILKYTTYTKYEILILDNETTDQKTLDYFETLQKHKNISILEYHKPFNYSAINNFGVEHANGEIVVLLNNDTEIITKNWLYEMVQHALRPEIGAVGAMLYYGDDTIQHGGVLLGIHGGADHSHKRMKRGSLGYFNRLVVPQNYSAVTGACMVIRKELYQKVGGLNEKNLVIAFNDVDFCLKLLEEGKRNLWTPYVELYHHESISRGGDDTKEKKERSKSELTYLKKNWKKRLHNDQYYNKNLSRLDTGFNLNIDAKRIPQNLVNRSDIRALKKKYKIQKFMPNIQKYLLFRKIPSQKRNKEALEILGRIPNSFIKIFDQESYVRANVDVQKNIEDDKFMNGWEHFILFGYKEVMLGKRRIGKQFPYFTEKEYARDNEDIVLKVEKGIYPSVFEYFLEFGYEEFLSKKRNILGTFPFVWTGSLREHVENYFDEDAYLKVNTDVKFSIERKEFMNGWEHFLLLGAEEVRIGDRMLHPKIGKISENRYAELNNDIFDVEKYGRIDSPFEHFLTYGAQEIIAGERIISAIKEYKYTEPRLTRRIENTMKNFVQKPLVSIIMPVYNVDVKWLTAAIDSLQKQWYPNWELCIADDASHKKETLNLLASLKDPKIKIVHLKKNLNISGASNAALKLASGQYIGLMDNDDVLTPDALYEMVKRINETQADFIYSDEDKIEEDGTLSEPHFKPDFSPDMFLSQNYISHFSVIKRTLVDKVKGWKVGLEGSQDYDLYLKVLELAKHVEHIPKILYHWRKVPGSTAVEFSSKSYAQEAGKQALKNAMLRRNIPAKVENARYPGTYRVKYDIKTSKKHNLPLVSIVIPFKDKPELLDVCINSVLDKSTYQNYEIIGISNNSEETETFEMMKSLALKDSRVSFYEYNVPFNYSQINNYAVKQYSKGKHILLLNNDIEVISEAWIESLLEFSQRDDVGAVGAKLYYPDDTIQHAGVTMGIYTLTGHNFKHIPRESTGYMGRESVVQNVSAVTAACLMIKKDIYLSIGGLNEKELKIAFNDIDFCLRVREEGYLNICTPYCEMYHHESITRGYEDTPKKLKRFNTEVAYMQERHHHILEKGDPYYNQNLTLESEDFGLN